jgi:hypothetical protein
VGVSAALPDRGGGRLLDASRVMEWPDLDFELTADACGLWSRRRPVPFDIFRGSSFKVGAGVVRF